MSDNKYTYEPVDPNDVYATSTLLPANLSQQLNDDPEVLHPLHPDVISRQATINIGTIGHVAHGKSTIVAAITGISTIRFHQEFERNITIKLGYANAKIYECKRCPPPHNYHSSDSKGPERSKCPRCSELCELVRHVSFVDCPGHNVYVSTMLSGASIMDATLLLIAADQPCPQPQTQEHLSAIEIVKLKDILVLQNKIDLISKEAALEHYSSIERFLHGTCAEHSIIIPISAQLKLNVDLVLYHIVNTISVPKRNLTIAPKFSVIRSFDVNKPGTLVKNLQGGVAGGALTQGMFRLGDIVEIRPGIITIDETDSNGKCICSPIFSQIISMKAEENYIRYAIPGGLIGVSTLIDPVLTRCDRLVGMIIGKPNQLPDILLEMSLEYDLLHYMLGTTQTIAPLSVSEIILVTAGSSAVTGVITELTTDSRTQKRCLKLRLKKPTCAEVNEKIAISRRMASTTGGTRSWRLVGWGSVMKTIDDEDSSSQQQ